jgi:hypothetical protein
MLSQYLTTFQGFFTRAFWFGSFLPVALFAFLHLVIAWVAFGNEAVPLQKWLTLDPTKLTLFPTIFAGLVVVSYALSPMLPLFRELLDGSALPDWLHEPLRRERKREAPPIRDKVEAAERLLNHCRDIRETLVARVAKARADGVANAPGALPNRPQIHAALGAADRLRHKLEHDQPLTSADVSDAVDELIAALEANDSSLPASAPNAQLSADLSKAGEAIFRLVANCEREAAHLEFALRTRHSRIAFDNPQATQMADARFLTESYCLNVYNVDFSYIWPRLQLVLPEQGSQGQVGSYNDRLVAARSQVDFAVLSLALSLTIPLLWLPLLAWDGTSMPLFLGIGVGAPLLAAFFYQLAVESQFEFGEVIKTAIDKYRFAVLKDLQQPLPPTLVAERELWHNLRVAEQTPKQTDLFYHHKPPSSPS